MTKIPKSKRGRKRYVFLSFQRAQAPVLTRLLRNLKTACSFDPRLQVLNQASTTSIIGCDHRALPLLLERCAKTPELQVRSVSGTLKGLKSRTRNL